MLLKVKIFREVKKLKKKTKMLAGKDSLIKIVIQEM